MSGGQLTTVVIVAILVAGVVFTVRRLMACQEKAEDEKTKRELAKIIVAITDACQPIQRGQ